MAHTGHELSGLAQSPWGTMGALNNAGTRTGLALMLDLLFPIRGQPGAEPRSGAEGENAFLISHQLESEGCLWHE